MSDLADKKCIPCEGNIPPFNVEEIHKYLKKVDGWEVLEDKVDGYHLIKNFNLCITPSKRNIRMMTFDFSYVSYFIYKVLAF